jgi:uncharacterized protein YkuJ
VKHKNSEFESDSVVVNHVSWKEKPRDLYFLRDFEDEKKKYYFRDLPLEN